MNRPDTGGFAGEMFAREVSKILAAKAVHAPSGSSRKLSTGQVLVEWPDGLLAFVPAKHTAERVRRAYCEAWVVRELLRIKADLQAGALIAALAAAAGEGSA